MFNNLLNSIFFLEFKSNIADAILKCALGSWQGESGGVVEAVVEVKSIHGVHVK